MTRIFVILLLVALFSGQIAMIVNAGSPPRRADLIPTWSHTVTGVGAEAVIEDEDPRQAIWDAIIIHDTYEGGRTYYGYSCELAFERPYCFDYEFTS